MKKLIVLAVLLWPCSLLFSQTPGLQWHRSLGGTSNDIANFSFKTADDGFIMVGSTLSNNGQVSGNHGGEDVWVVKLTKEGFIQWSKCLGGSGTDVPVDAVYKNGYLTIASNSNSVNGDITNNHGGTDIWVVKLDSLGNTIWQNSYGGTGADVCSNIIAVSSSGFALAGSTTSTDSNHTFRDLWVLRVSEAGTLLWQIPLGGSNNEVASKAKIMETKTGGNFIIGTETYSNNGNVLGFHGQSDTWVVKLNNAGQLVWQICLGGPITEYFSDVKEDASGNIFVLSQSYSYTLPGFHGNNSDYSDIYVCKLSSSGSLLLQKCFGSYISDLPHQLMILSDDNLVISAEVANGDGDVTGYHGSYSGYDYWMLKLTPALGIIWNRSLGGTDQDGSEGASTTFRGASGAFIQTMDQGFLITAYTESRNNGDVSGYHYPSDPYDTTRADVWIVKLNAGGSLQWQKAIGGSRGEWARGAAVEIGANEFYITAYTNSNNYDATRLNGGFDAYVFKLGAVNRIKGTLFIDYNSNGQKESNEPNYSNAIITSKKASDSISSVPVNGLFINEVDTGSYLTTVKVVPSYYNAVPSSKTSIFTSYFNVDSFSFALQPIANKKDLTINLIPVTAARPGFATAYRILYQNIGTTTISAGTVALKKDSRLNFVSSSPVTTATSGDTLTWNYTNFAPGDTASILLNFTVAPPPTVNINDTLLLKAFIDPVAGDETPANDTAILRQRVIGSYDPNDKTESNEGVVQASFITKGTPLQYTVRFQNTGLDTAFNIVVRDTLGSRVDFSSLQMVAASHPCTLTIENGNILTWKFTNILLPNASINEPASHGYVVYTIKPKADVAIGEIIHNTASIYFDFNLPMLTNDAITKVQANLVILPQGLLNFYGNRKEQQVQLFWQMAETAGLKRFSIERSFDGLNYTQIGTYVVERSRINYMFTDLSLTSAPIIFYRLVMVAMDGSYKYSNVLMFSKKSNDMDALVVSPNPIIQHSTILFNSAKTGTAEIQLVNTAGHIISRQQINVVKGTNIYSLEKSSLAAGVYHLRVITGTMIKNTSLFVK